MQRYSTPPAERRDVPNRVPTTRPSNVGGGPSVPPTSPRKIPFVWIALAVLLLWPLFSTMFQTAPGRVVPYSDLVKLVDDGRVARAEIRDTSIVATLKPGAAAEPSAQGSESAPAPSVSTPEKPGAAAGEGERVQADRVPGMDETSLLTKMQEKGVVVTGEIDKSSGWWVAVLGWVLPFVFLGVIWFAMSRATRGIGGGMSSPFNAFKSHAKLYDASKAEKVTFADVAGVDEAKDELEEVVHFLAHPERYRSIGARIPRGVLLVGPPGTGKTLLARAVAGEAGVPFFSLSGSEFVEMFVGLGAKRIRDLFEQAKAKSPCIVFIDEIDAIGKSRGGMSAIATHDEREQTLNQLLAEMDGFAANQGVIVIAATNRPEVLDRALLRPGRFDRQVLVDRPDVSGREAILKVHGRKIVLGRSVDLRIIARRTPMMSGADLANIVNEAAIAAARDGSPAVERQHFEEAIDRVTLGLKRRGKVLGEREKRRVAIHEAGHAIVALSVPNADPVHRITIIPRSIGALGGTLQLPTDERFLMTCEELRDRICVYMGGTAAEDVLLGQISTGAQNDLERATELAKLMVTRFGMASRLAPRMYGHAEGAPGYGANAFALHEDRGFSEETARLIDAEIASIMERERERAKMIVRDRRHALERVVDRLLEVETLEGEEFENIVEASAVRERPTGTG